MVNIKIGIDCSLDDVDITAELRVIGGLVYSTVTFQSHLICNFFPIVNVRLLNKVCFKESICIYTAQITKLDFNQRLLCKLCIFNVLYSPACPDRLLSFGAFVADIREVSYQQSVELRVSASSA